MGDQLLTVKDVTARLALGRTTVYELIAKRELKTIKIGRARRILESALEEWIRQQVDEQGDRDVLDARVAKAVSDRGMVTPNHRPGFRDGRR